LTDASLELTDTSVASTDAPLKLTDAPVASTDASLKLTDAPVASTDASLKLTDAPVASTDAPLKLTDAPVASTDAPLKLVRPALCFSAVPSRQDLSDDAPPLRAVGRIREAVLVSRPAPRRVVASLARERCGVAGAETDGERPQDGQDDEHGAGVLHGLTSPACVLPRDRRKGHHWLRPPSTPV
jgi:hypothetical protein